jgi:hypothetical protein
MDQTAGNLVLLWHCRHWICADCFKACAEIAAKERQSFKCPICRKVNDEEDLHIVFKSSNLIRNLLPNHHGFGGVVIGVKKSFMEWVSSNGDTLSFSVESPQCVYSDNNRIMILNSVSGEKFKILRRNPYSIAELDSTEIFHHPKILDVCVNEKFNAVFQFSNLEFAVLPTQKMDPPTAVLLHLDPDFETLSFNLVRFFINSIFFKLQRSGVAAGVILLRVATGKRRSSPFLVSSEDDRYDAVGKIHCSEESKGAVAFESSTLLLTKIMVVDFMASSKYEVFVPAKVTSLALYEDVLIVASLDQKTNESTIWLSKNQTVKKIMSFNDTVLNIVKTKMCFCFTCPHNRAYFYPNSVLLNT